MISREVIASRVAERNRGDVPDAVLTLVVGAVFTLLGLCFVNVFLFFLCLSWLPKQLLLSNVALAAVLGAVNAALILVLALDTWWHPMERWVKIRFVTVSGETMGPQSPYVPMGAPLMTSVTDPANWAMVARASLNALANVLLAGPRQVREGLGLAARIRRRNSPASQLAAAAVLEWLERRGGATGVEMTAYVSQMERRVDGVALASELGFLIEVETAEGLAYRVAP